MDYSAAVSRSQYDLRMRQVCPHCGVLAHFTEVWSVSNVDDDIFHVEGIFARFCWTCDSCFRPVCGIFTARGAVSDPPIVWPTAVTYRTYDDVPEAIASAASEAHQALGAKAPRASVAMARAVVEATAKDKGIPGRNIRDKIEGLAAGGHISESMREAAHEIRFAGNEAAHGDLVETISVEEAAEVVELMDAILERVYQEPAKVARVRASREARKNREVATQTESDLVRG